MALKLMSATEFRTGNAIIIEKKHFLIKSIDISKTGKHGHAKVRIEATGIFDSKKKVLVVPGHEKFEVPEINKLRAQVLSVQENTANIMDLETYETIDVQIDEEMKGKISEGDNVEYWNVEGNKIIKRKV